MASGLDLLAINTAKLTKVLIKLFNLGEGTALPGRVALAISPNLLQSFSKKLSLPRKAHMQGLRARRACPKLAGANEGSHNAADESFQVGSLQSIITGTNGKTTTAGLLREIYKLAGKEDPISNVMGANLYYGILAEFINSSDLSGKLKSNNFVLEVDEATLPEIAKIIPAKTITVTNLFRDQLDRFGEIDATQKLIIKGINNGSKLEAQSSKAFVVLNSDDAKVWNIQKHIEGFEIFSFTVKADRELTNFDSCSKQDHEADLICEALEEQKIKLIYKDQNIEIDFKLPGLYNVYNATAAAATALVAGVDLETIKQGIENYRGNFGRAEIKQFNSVEFQAFLIKNPSGATEVLKDLATKPNAKYLIVINDNYADGRDVSWLWDAQFELVKTKSEIICSGSRAEDMAVRLKYAGINAERIRIIKDLKEALIASTSTKQNNETLFVLPTYTALLELNRMGS